LALEGGPLSSTSSKVRRSFTPEFKAEAVAMVEASGGNIARVAKELKIYDSTLGNWVRQARAEAAGAPSAEERAEMRELKRELERVRRERDILAKAVAFFSASTRISV
jgi:transposase